MTSYIEQALVFIGSAVILVPIFQRLGFGSVLGYLIAGILVGPYGFKLIQDSESVFHFSELGIIFLLFIIGLEIHPRKLWSMRKHLVYLGGLQILLCSIAFFIAAYLMGLPPLAAGIIGFAFSLSSTAFAVQALTEKNLFNTGFGRASFSILLMQDLVAIPALAIIPALAVTSSTKISSSPNMWVGLSIIIGLVIISRFLIRPLFRMTANLRSREVFIAVTLFIVLGVAELMQKVGLSAALGTFIAGVLLADSEYRHELETNLEPFKGLLMGLFFIAVGMGVNLHLLQEQPVVIFAITLAYVLGKAFLTYLVGRWVKLDHGNAKLMALNIAQGGEFAFVIFGIVAQLSLINSETISFLTVIITLSIAVNPIISMINHRFSRLSKRNAEPPSYDEIKDNKAEVIVAGFGRFGQTFGRILRAQSIRFVAIDHDPNQIEMVRKFGNKVYYGDASRLDILKAAGAEKAKYFILAIDDIESSLATAAMVKENFPNLKIFARARNRGHAFDLMNLGITTIKREVFDSSVNFVQDLMIEMGFEQDRAEMIIEKFKTHDQIMLTKQFKVRQDDKMFISVSHQGAAQLAQVLSGDDMQTHIVDETENN